MWPGYLPEDTKWPGWHSVDYDLPGYNELVIAFVPSMGPYFAYYQNGVWYVVGGKRPSLLFWRRKLLSAFYWRFSWRSLFPHLPVTHWMPRPPLPEGHDKGFGFVAQRKQLEA